MRSTNCQKFCRDSPNNTFQLVHTRLPCKRKLRNAKIASFCRCTTRKTCKTSKFHTPQFAVRGRDTQRTTLNAQKLAPNNRFRSCIVSNLDKPAYETTHTSFLNHLDKCKKPFSPQYATRNHLSEAPPMRTQQGTSEIKQEDHHEHKSKEQRHRRGNHWRLRLKLGNPPPQDDGHGHHDNNDCAK